MDQSKTPSAKKPMKLLRLKEVEDLTGLRKTSIYQRMKETPPTFPRCVRLSTKAVAWRESDIADWQANLETSGL